MITMKRCILLFLACFVVVLCTSFSIFSSFATDSVNEDSSESTENTDEPSELDFIIHEEVSRSISPVTPSDSNGLKKVMLQLIGDYETVVTEHRYTNSNGYTSISVSTEPDYSWLCSCAIFLVVLFCIFRLIGGVICGRS